MEQWYAVHTKPSKEQVATDNLFRQGFNCFFPRIKKIKKRAGKRITSISAFFPRYVFVCLNLKKDNVSSIRSTIGVCDLVRFGHHIIPVPKSVISKLKQRQDSEGLVEVEPKHLIPGQQVSIEEGPLAGLNSVFEAQTGSDRAILLLNILGNQRRVEVPMCVLG